MLPSDKRYILASFATQFILVPVMITIGFVAFASSTMHTMAGLGYHAERFIYLVATGLGSLIAGGFIGFMFSLVTTHKPASLQVKYITPVIPIFYALFFAVLVSALSGGNTQSNWWALHLFKNPFFLIYGISVMFSGLNFLVPVAELMGYTGFLAGMLLQRRFSDREAGKKAPGAYRVVTITPVVLALAFTVISTFPALRNGIDDLRYGGSAMGSELTEYDLFQIAPFKENNGLARLGHPAALQFEGFEKMPRLDGATAFYPVYAAFVEAVYQGLGDYYEGNKDDYSKDIISAFVASEEYPFSIVMCTKTGAAYDRLINGEADIIFVLEPSKTHAEAIRAKGDDFVLTPIANEAFVFFTNLSNPVENLSVKQIQAIYSGEITNWREVGGENRAVLPYQRPENSGSQTIMQNRVMKNIAMLEPTVETYAGGMGQVISQVANYRNARNAIGYSFRYYSSEMVTNNQIKYVSVNGVMPTPETIRDNSYPFTVPVYAVTLASNNEENVLALLEWVTSDEGQRLVRETGYVSILE